MYRRKARAAKEVRDLPDFFGLRYFFAVLFFLIMLGYWIRLLS